MNIYKHTTVSLTVSALIFIISKNLQISISCFLSGIFIDIDHIFDYYMNYGIISISDFLLHPKKLMKLLSFEYRSYRSLFKIYKPFHSIELLLPASLLYISGIWNDIATGILIGFMLHLAMDFISFGHFGGISMVYKIVKRFPKGGDILRQRLSNIGITIDRCQICGAEGKMIPHSSPDWYIGFTKKRLGKLMILCRECHNKAHNRKT